MTQAFNKRPKIPNKLVLTAKEVKNRYLFGVDLTNDDGEPIAVKDIEFWIRSAQSWLQKELPGLLLFETDIVDERHDYYLADYMSHNFVKLYRYPVQEVTKVAMKFPMQTQELQFDPSWYRAESVGAQVQLVPAAGSFNSIVMSQGGSYLSNFYHGQHNMPLSWGINYKAGFPPGEIPEDIIDIIGLKASIQPMNLAGDLIAGAGIASKNISMDGLSQGIVTTASAENTGYTANIKQREKEIISMLKHLKEYYIGISMVVG